MNIDIFKLAKRIYAPKVPQLPQWQSTLVEIIEYCQSTEVPSGVVLAPDLSKWKLTTGRESLHRRYSGDDKTAELIGRFSEEVCPHLDDILNKGMMDIPNTPYTLSYVMGTVVIVSARYNVRIAIGRKLH